MDDRLASRIGLVLPRCLFIGAFCLVKNVKPTFTKTFHCKLNLQFSLFEVLLIIGVTQGFVIASLIWFNKNRNTSKLLLSLVLMVFNLLCIKILIHTTGLWQTNFFRYFPLPFELAIQPLIWLYVSALIMPNFKLNGRKLIHFIPFAISFGYSLFVYLLVLSQKEIISKDMVANSFHFNTIKEIEDYLSVISAVTYWLVGFRLILNYRRWLYNNISNTDYPTYAWLKNLSILIGILIIGLAADVILDYYFRFNVHHFGHWQVFFVYLAVLIYYLGFKGFQLPNKQVVKAEVATEQTENFRKDTNIATQNNNVAPTTSELQILNEEIEIKLPDEKSQLVEDAIRNAFEVEELYLDSELNLQKLATAINFSTIIVSTVINNHFKKSFRNLVNEYRVNKVKQRLQEPTSNQFSILGIAYECGFNSESSFYRIFKTEVGISPKEYINQLPSAE